EWEDFDLDQQKLDNSKKAGISRFNQSLKASMSQLKQMIPNGANLFFAHTMAGGMPRAKALFLLINHVVKGQGKRFLSSKRFVDSNIGNFVLDNMREVTASTLGYLIDETSEIREMVTEWGGNVCYSAYGYHGTEILINEQYQWQSYSPYLTGWGKIELENIAVDAMEKGIQAVVYNCPEIRTNSSDI
ncbi:MAG: hypothetical protein GY786_13255, partial [Proteobacteria bacterium]|nr:hypothetical protein [Pseudomonadota bacterium]